AERSALGASARTLVSWPPPPPRLAQWACLRPERWLGATADRIRWRRSRSLAAAASSRTHRPAARCSRTGACVGHVAVAGRGVRLRRHGAEPRRHEHATERGSSAQLGARAFYVGRALPVPEPAQREREGFGIAAREPRHLGTEGERRLCARVGGPRPCLRFKPELKRQDRINWRVRYIEGDLTRFERQALDDALAAPSEPLSEQEKREFLAGISEVSLVSDGFIPFRDNIDHAQRHGV